MGIAVRLLSSTAFMMGIAVVVSLLTNEFITGLYPDFLAGNSSLRSNITIFLLACMLTVTMSRIPYRNLNPVRNAKSVTRAVLLGLIVASTVPPGDLRLLLDGLRSQSHPPSWSTSSLWRGSRWSYGLPWENRST